VLRRVQVLARRVFALTLTLHTTSQCDIVRLTDVGYVKHNHCRTFTRLRPMDDSPRCPRWLRGPAVEHRSLADVLSLSCARLVADG